MQVSVSACGGGGMCMLGDLTGTSCRKFTDLTNKKNEQKFLLAAQRFDEGSI